MAAHKIQNRIQNASPDLHAPSGPRSILPWKAPDHPNRPLSSGIAGLRELFRPLGCGTCFLSRYRRSQHLWSDWKPSSLWKLRVKDVLYPVIILAQLGLIIGSSHPTFSYSQVMLLQAGDARLEKHDPLTCFSRFIASWLHVFTSSPPPLLLSPFCRSVFDVINTHFLWSLGLFLSFPLHCCYQQDGSGTFWPSLAQHFFLLKASSSFTLLLAQGSGSAFLWNVWRRSW